MSTTVLRYIPEEPTFVPGEDEIVASRVLLTRSAGKAAQARVSESVEFVDPGEGLDRVLCPACGQQLEMEWWQERMTAAAEDAFRDLGVTVPCCGAETSLHDLEYDQPAGFARFILEVEDPDGAEDKVDVEALERIVGCMLRRVVARY
jgi:hypothetical protein